jgi:SAM-dependent methyltransferase
VDWDQGRYEHIAEQLLPAARMVVETAAPEAAERTLDLGCGTGSAALLAAARGADVTALDPSPRLLGVAGAQAAARGLKLSVLSGAAERIPLPDAGLDVVLSSFGVIFTPDPKAAAAEIARVLDRPGRIVLSAWIPGGPLAEMMRARAQAMADAGSQAPPPPPTAWHDASVLSELFSPHGFSVEVERHSLDFLAASAADFMDGELRDHPGWIAAKALLAPLGKLQPLRERATAILEAANEQVGGFRVSSAYAVARLRR